MTTFEIVMACTAYAVIGLLAVAAIGAKTGEPAVYTDDRIALGGVGLLVFLFWPLMLACAGIVWIHNLAARRGK